MRLLVSRVLVIAVSVAAIAAVVSFHDTSDPEHDGSSVKFVAAQCALTPTNGTVVRTIGSRIYRLFVPAGLTGRSVSLLLAEHGNASNAADFEQVSGWSPYAAAHNFIVAYPQGNANNQIPNAGDGLVGNDWLFSQGSADVTFLRAVVADIAATWCVDPKRVYSSGWSDGAIMSQRMACDAPDVFASATSWEGADPTLPNPTFLIPSPPTPCTPARPISVGVFQGQLDTISDQAIGLANATAWVHRDACPAVPVRTTDTYGTTSKFGPCGSGTAVWWRVVNGLMHVWPSGAIGQDLRDKLWGFMTSYTLP